MPALEIPNLPEDVFKQIETLARVRGQSVGDVAADFLRKALTGEDEAEAKLLADIRREREELAAKGVYLTKEMINEAKAWGRR